MKKIVILDASTGIAHIIKNNPKLITAEEIEEYIEKTLNISISDCQWMITNEITGLTDECCADGEMECRHNHH